MACSTGSHRFDPGHPRRRPPDAGDGCDPATDRRLPGRAAVPPAAAAGAHGDRPRRADGAAVLHRHRGPRDHGGDGGRRDRHRRRCTRHGGVRRAPPARPLRGRRGCLPGWPWRSSSWPARLAYALSGPAHLGSTVWPGIYGHLARKQRTSLEPLLLPAVSAGTAWWQPLTTACWADTRGRSLSYQYFGTLMTAVVLGGVAVWRRDRRLWLFGAIAVISARPVLRARDRTSGCRGRRWRTCRILENVVPYRLVLDHRSGRGGHARADRRAHLRRGQPSAAHAAPAPRCRRRTSLWARLPQWTGCRVAAVVAVIALVQPASYLARTIPMTTVPVALPTWFTAVAPHLPRTRSSSSSPPRSPRSTTR